MNREGFYVINWPVLNSYCDVRNLELINLGPDSFHIRTGKNELERSFFVTVRILHDSEV